MSTPTPPPPTADLPLQPVGAQPQVPSSAPPSPPPTPTPTSIKAHRERSRSFVESLTNAQLPLYNPLFKPTARRILLSAVKAWSTGYAAAAVPTIVSLVLKQILGGGKGKAGKGGRVPLADLPARVIAILVASLRGRMPWFFMALIGGFRLFDRLSWEIVGRFGKGSAAAAEGLEMQKLISKEMVTENAIAKSAEEHVTTTSSGVSASPAAVTASHHHMPPIPPASHILTPTFVAAALSSALALLVVKPTQRADFAVFTLVRAVDSLASFQGRKIRDAMRARGVPQGFITNADAVVFIACCTQIMFCWFFFPQALPRNYVNWINKMGHMDPRVLRVVKYLGHGIMKKNRDDGYGHILGSYAVEIGRTFAEGDPKNGQISCNIIHADSPHCGRHLLEVWRDGFGDAMKLYIPVHLLPALIFHRNRFANRKEIGPTIANVARGAVQSSAFLATFIVLIWAPICGFRNALKTDGYIGPGMGSFLAGFSIFVERKSRRREIGLYCAPKALESAWWMLTRNKVKIPGAEFVMFATGMGYLLSSYQYHPKALRPAVRSALGFFLV
ncbi:hypothetical protein HDU87_005158 [Geranomyces variabilis]|uniref:Transmembrane protein 135 N-terminal domain-containing protein n=1 Tax=Geranomyces variabilis TaxID=109894 RepID=A0AAD5XUB4_9FUNG|nr:hypothetical protein HDU87_005158 [Geranomyces variabilis]